MKKILFIFPLLLITGTAHAISMCVPSIKASQDFSNIPSADEDGNRGYFAMGTNCTSGTVVCKKTLLRGEAHCSASTIVPSDNFETKGMYCYCRLTDVMAPNGYLAPHAGGWVLHDSTGTVSSCITTCSSLCGKYARSNLGFRKALFITPMLSE